MTNPGFEAMRASLVERGLIDAEYRLTPAGFEYTEDLIARLSQVHDQVDYKGSTVRWRT